MHRIEGLSKKAKNNAGFTLIELSLVILIMGMIVLPIFKLLNLADFEKRKRQDTIRMEMLHRITWNYGLSSYRYLCPADPTLSPVHPEYGVGKRAVPGDFTSPCDIPALPGTAGYGWIPGIDGRIVLYGMFPIRDVINDSMKNSNPLLPGPTSFTADMLQNIKNEREEFKDIFETFSLNTAYDSWGRAYTYAVTFELTENATFDPLNGAISIQDEFGNSLVDPDDPDLGAHFAIISHGPDGRGGYMPSGQQYFACPGVGASVDRANCNWDEDSIVVSGISAYAPGANYYDDKIRYYAKVKEELWTSVASGIHNTQDEGSVGVGVADPEEKLHIAGSVQTELVSATQYCNEDGSECFDPTIITQFTDCPAGQAFVGFYNGVRQCEDRPEFIKTTYTCPNLLKAIPDPPDALYVQRIFSDGTYTCVDKTGVAD